MTSNKPISKNNHIINEGTPKIKLSVRSQLSAIYKPRRRIGSKTLVLLCSMFLIACQGNLLPGNISL